MALARGLSREPMQGQALQVRLALELRGQGQIGNPAGRQQSGQVLLLGKGLGGPLLRALPCLLYTSDAADDTARLLRRDCQIHYRKNE